MNDRSQLPPGIADRLRAIVGERGIVADDHAREPFEVDWRGHVAWQVRHPDHHHDARKLRNGNVVLLWAYTLSCHSCRHIIGGRLKHFSAHPVRYRLWTAVSTLNTRHMLLAWVTLGTLALTDFYVMAISAGWFPDLRFIN